MEHIHISKVLDFGFDEQHNFKALKWGCSLCDETSDAPFEHEDIEIDHTACDEDCFGCKVKTLQMNAGDATRAISDKKWTGELNAYKEARAQGMQPAGTTRQHVEAAHKASEVLNQPYNAEKMPPARYINKKTTEVLKEVGTI
jgi:hypothetical protein